MAQAPDRRFDSRESEPVQAGHDRVVPLFGGTPPTGATAAVVSVTSLGTPGNADVQLYAAGDRPAARTSTLNLRRGQTVANLAVVPVDAQGRVAVSVSQGIGRGGPGPASAGYVPTSPRGYEPLVPSRVSTADRVGAGDRRRRQGGRA